tara:strand:- start:113 stop:715 length:603 start_codon:yes stop_codon:yes gene_type:complete
MILDAIYSIKSRYYMDILGLIIYAILFYCGAFLLYINQFYYALEVYLPNIDLIANLLTWLQGPYGIWKNLYLNSTYTATQYISQTIVNYFALLGLTYIVARESTNTNIISGWSIAFVMLLCTYLLPSKVTTLCMDEVWKDSRANSILHDYAGFISTIVGIIVTFIFLFVELFVLAKYRQYLQHFANGILDIPRYFYNKMK